MSQMMYNKNMKLLKKLFYAIVFLIMLSCAGVLFLALSPGLTQKISTMLYGEEGPEAYMRKQASAGEGGEVSGTDGAVILTDGFGIAAGVLASEGSAGYVAPLRGALKLPDQVSGKNGYEPVNGDGEELGDEQADALGTQLGAGATGDGLSFDAQFYPYYHMLNDKMQHLYRQIYANALELNASFAPVEQVNTDQLKNVFEAVCNDHPEIFWLEPAYACKYRSDNVCVEMTLRYNRTAQSLEQSRAEFTAESEKILIRARSFESDSEKEEYVHNALMEKADYAVSAAMNQSAYSALVNGDTVCAGYSKAFQYLMRELGVPCYYCTGYSGQDHAWNIVKVDDEHRNVDVTWDDTNPSTHDYYNKTDADFVGTHVRTGLSIYLPACGQSYSGDGSVSASGNGTVAGITLNPNPQQPLTWEPGAALGKPNRVTVSGGDTCDLGAAGLTADMVQDSMKAYYEDCLKQMEEKGGGQKAFNNIVPKYVLTEVEKAYGTGAYQKGYVDEGLKKLKLENFAIQIQVEELGGNYYRLYHNIYTW